MADYKSGGSCGAALKSTPAFARGRRFTGAARGAGVRWQNKGEEWGVARRRGTRGPRELPEKWAPHVSRQSRPGTEPPTDFNQEQGAGEGGQGNPTPHHHLWVISGLWNPEGILRGQVISGDKGAGSGWGTAEVPPSHPNPHPWPAHASLF